MIQSGAAVPVAPSLCTLAIKYCVSSVFCAPCVLVCLCMFPRLLWVFFRVPDVLTVYRVIADFYRVLSCLRADGLKLGGVPVCFCSGSFAHAVRLYCIIVLVMHSNILSFTAICAFMLYFYHACA